MATAVLCKEAAGRDERSRAAISRANRAARSGRGGHSSWIRRQNPPPGAYEGTCRRNSARDFQIWKSGGREDKLANDEGEGPPGGGPRPSPLSMGAAAAGQNHETKPDAPRRARLNTRPTQ